MRLIDADALYEREYARLREGEVLEYFEPMDIDSMPTVEERKTGHWEEFEFEYADREYVGYKCSECDSRCLTTDFEKYKYCPYCGAKMEGEE